MPQKSRYSVLLYHGVHADDVVLSGRNIFGKHVSQSRFAQEIAWLAVNRPLVTMRDIADAHHQRRDLPDGAVAITFDDGFRNNHDTAWPILEQYGVPATIYIATGYIGTGRMIWTDRLEAAFLESERNRLDATIQGRRFDYHLNDESMRTSSFLDVKAWCKTLPATELESAVDEILDALDFAPVPDSPLYAFADWDQVRAMAKSPLIDIGAHTVDHVSLAKTPEPEMRRQIDESLAHVTHELERPCDLFSYPEGTEADYDDAVIDHLRSHGIDHAPSAIEGDNEIGTTDPFHIRRHLVGIGGRPMPLMQTNSG